MSAIIAILFKHNSISVEELRVAAANKGRNITSTSHLVRLVNRYPGELRIVRDGRREICEYKPVNIEVCMRKNCNQGPSCSKLHVCTFFVKGRCSKGVTCPHPHDLSSPSNIAYLNYRGLQDVDMKDIFLKIHFKEGSLSVCTFYNSERGCRNSDDCNFLHICRQYVDTKCAASCKYNHDVFTTNCKRVLSMHGICVDQRPIEIIQDIKQKIKMPNTTIAPSAIPATLPGRPMSPQTLFQIPRPISPPTSPSKQLTSLKEAICTYNIREKCRYNESCIRQHHTLPYQWFYMDGLMWKPFTEETQTKLEEDYCNVSKRGYKDKKITVYFDKMGKDSKVVRLSTPSSVTEPPNHPFTTKWTWYWQDNSVNAKSYWREYTQKSTVETVSDKDSEELEKHYQMFLEDSSFSIVTFNVGPHKYKLNFDKMEQESLTFKTIRCVRRRPAKLVTKHDIVRYKMDVKLNRSKGITTSIAGASSSTRLPDCWENVEQFDPQASFQLVDVKVGCQEYNEVKLLFKLTCNHKILKIQRVQNQELWEDYQRKQERMIKKLPPGTTVERRLWHGTREYHTQAICQQNFDFRCSGSSFGTAFGQGSYFARDAKFSTKYAICANDGHKFVFLAKVLVGEYTKGKTSHRRPPEKLQAGNSKSLYDSCVDDTIDPSIFVIFDKDQMYPEYLVQY
ncbi:protein mono-ADP-ribosyltransferase PARP12-like [Antedon mediterranea]|uniref:protein mono-ADP-ribosyltransferase PARP12-like n=1 Tax=Antedon mediterranea TaxID=105859 RepID=UPI003AF9E8E6